jgi:catechol 2,3-dioxygenase-like lactoylglutathione lyase family enzyme
MAEVDERPPVWVGHISLETDRLDDSSAFMQKLGMRPIFKGETVAVLELRAGTHLILQQKDAIEPKTAGFDLMVEDLEATHARLTDLGIDPSEIEPGKIHSSFTVQDPSGNTIKFNSSHNSDQPV